MCFREGIVCLLIFCCSFAGGQDVTVVTDIGTIVGEVISDSFNGTRITVNRFLGIPFAEPPIRDRRFQRPVKKAAFTEPFHAKTKSPQCIQNLTLLGSLNVPLQSEDCLHLNILSPVGSTTTIQKKAVMIWLFGGGFQGGGQDMYMSPGLVALNDVILVTLNYRVTVLGFLSTGDPYLPGNYGLWDQHMAIQWVHDHIDKFGGDPTNVTIFGESAGAASVIYQALYDGNQGLFQRVIAQSGSINVEWAFDNDPGTRFDNMVNKSNCIVGTRHSVIRCLRNKTTSELRSVLTDTDNFIPVLDGTFIKVRPSDLFQNKTERAWEIQQLFGKLDLIIGVNSDEAGAWVAFFDAILNANYSRFNSYSHDAFENVIVPMAFSWMQRTLTHNTHSAVVHQYINWKDPYNARLIRFSTLDLLSDMVQNAVAISTANVHADTGGTGRTFFYIYDYQLSQMHERWYTGADHREELPLVFAYSNIKEVLSIFGAESPEDGVNLTATDILMTRQIMAYWTNFAKSG